MASGRLQAQRMQPSQEAMFMAPMRAVAWYPVTDRDWRRSLDWKCPSRLGSGRWDSVIDYLRSRNPILAAGTEPCSKSESRGRQGAAAAATAAGCSVGITGVSGGAKCNHCTKRGEKCGRCGHNGARVAGKAVCCG